MVDKIKRHQQQQLNLVRGGGGGESKGETSLKVILSSTGSFMHLALISHSIYYSLVIIKDGAKLIILKV